MDHSSQAYNYDIIFVHTGISENNRHLMQTMILDNPNFSLRFLDISDSFQASNLVIHSHFSIETFYRLVIPWVLIDYEKVIYLDSDLIILRDLADLFEVEIGDNLLAATIDAEMACEYNGSILGVKEYCDTVLKLENPYSYFQAGVLLLNLCAFRKTFAPYELLELAEKRNYHYVDQDVLNVACSGRMYPLAMNWDVLTDAGGRINEIRKRAPKAICQAYQEARQHPFIIHYAGWEKPWDSPQSDFAEIYWQYARKTPFYEVNLLRLIHKKAIQGNLQTEPAGYQSRVRKLADKLLPKGSRRRNLAKKILPKGSRRWNFCKKIYYKIFKR